MPSTNVQASTTHHYHHHHFLSLSFMSMYSLYVLYAPVAHAQYDPVSQSHRILRLGISNLAPMLPWEFLYWFDSRHRRIIAPFSVRYTHLDFLAVSLLDLHHYRPLDY